MRSWKYVPIAAVAVLTASACGGGGGETAAAGEGGVTASELRVGYASELDSADIAGQLGIQELDGPDPVIASEDSAIISGLLSGEFEIGNTDLLAAMLARNSGAEITVIYPELMTYQYVMIAAPGIQDLDDLAGKTVAFHSPGSEDEILCRELVRQHDPELEEQINWTVLPESPNRASALVSGEIDATALEFGDTLTVADNMDVTTLGGWSDVEGPSSAAIANSWVVADEFLAENEEAVAEFVAAAQDGYDTFYSDKDAWMTAAGRLLPEAVAEERLSAIYDFYREVQLYPQEGNTLDMERWEQLNDFFVGIEQIEAPAPDEMVRFDLIEGGTGQD